MGPQACNFLFAVLVFFLAFVTWPYRGENMNLQKLNNDVIGTNLHVIRHRDPLLLRVDKVNIPDIVEI